MKTSEAVAHFNSVKELADALGITTEAIYQWGEMVPLGRAYQLQVMTSGKLQAAPNTKAAAAA